MGEVYRVHDTKLQEEMALKLLRPEIANNPVFIRRFRNELKLARKITHRNVCRVFDFHEEEGTPFITMEYVKGESLHSLIKSKGKLEEAEAIRIAAQVAEGLAEAHDLGVVHRDLKPQNILIGPGGGVKIMDFGIARSIQETGITQVGHIVGTPDYISAEQAAGQPADHRADIYALGVLLYVMTTGQLPFKGDSAESVILQHKEKAPADPREINPEISAGLARLILCSMVKDRECRYQAARELLENLRTLSEGVESDRGKKSPRIFLKISRKRFILGSLFLAVAIIAMALFLFKGKPEPGIPVIEPGEKLSIAVVYFENKSGDENLDNWRDAFSELLTTDLAQSRYIRVLRSDQIYGILKQLDLLETKRYSEQDLEKIAKNGRVNHILKGSYIKAGDNFVITAILINAETGETVSSLSVKAESEKNIFPKVDELTREIKLGLQLTSNQISNDIDEEVGTITTSSPEALKYYLEGRKYHTSTEFRKSIQLMEKALTIDPEFAMAYRSLGVSWGIMGYFDRRTKYLNKAMKFSSRLSDRERYHITGSFYKESEKNCNKAIEAYQKLLQLYPDDFLGNISLGELYLNLEEWDKAIDRFETNIRNKDDRYYAYSLASRAYLAKGMYSKAEKILKYYLKHFSDHSHISLSLALVYTSQRKLQPALSEAEKAISLSSQNDFSYFWKGAIHYLNRDFDKAIKVYQSNLEFKEKTTRVWSALMTGHIFLTQGKYIQAQDQLEKTLEKARNFKLKTERALSHLSIGYILLRLGKYEKSLSKIEQSLVILETIDRSLNTVDKVKGYYWKARTALESGSADQVRKREDELVACVKSSMNKKLIRFYYLFLGQKELKKGRLTGAINHFNRALSLLPYQSYGDYDDHALFIEPLALAYYKSGNLEAARAEYEKIISLTIGRLAYGDIYAKAFYQLGTIYEQKGLKARPIFHFLEFINIWKDCDARFQPMVEYAKKRVKELTSNSRYF
jgi:serine/threonine protein kinase/lipopolysaccharide biosynthesis regulator YciM